jgi:hypothetical protein
VTFDWSPPVSGSVSRYWLWQTPNSMDWAVAAIVPAAQSSVTILGYVPGRTYTVQLASQGTDLGFTPLSTFQFTGSNPQEVVHLGTAGTPVTADPVVPGQLSGTYSMLFQWDPPASAAGLTGYQVLKSTDAINWSVAAEVPASQMSTTVPGFEWNQIYYMGIASVSANGVSPVNVVTPMDYASDLSQVNIYLLQPLNPP